MSDYEYNGDDDLTTDPDAPLVLSLGRRQKKVQLQDPENGDTKNYTLKELMGTDRDLHLNEIAKRSRIGPDGPGGVMDFKGLHAGFIARGLFDEDDKPVPARIVQQWPSSVQSVLFTTLLKMSGMDKDAAEAAKNG